MNSVGHCPSNQVQDSTSISYETVRGAVREWASILTIACSAAVGSRKQTDAMGRLR